jgi:hypothetical protein
MCVRDLQAKVTFNQVSRFARVPCYWLDGCSQTPMLVLAAKVLEVAVSILSFQPQSSARSKVASCEAATFTRHWFWKLVAGHGACYGKVCRVGILPSVSTATS